MWHRCSKDLQFLLCRITVYWREDVATVPKLHLLLSWVIVCTEGRVWQHCCTKDLQSLLCRITVYSRENLATILRQHLLLSWVIVCTKGGCGTAAVLKNYTCC